MAILRKHLLLLCAAFPLYFSSAAEAQKPGTLVGWGEVPWTLLQHRALTNITALAISGAHGLALRDNGTVRITGPHGDSRWVPGEATNIVSVAGGFHHLALRADGTVISWERVWGWPDPPEDLTNAVLVTGSNLGGVAVTRGGQIISWGLPAPNINAADAVALAGGQHHYVLLRSDGTVFAWGDNSAGQTNVPPGLSNVTAIATEGDHTLALRADGTVVAWGSNTQGQIDVTPGLTNVVSVAAGAFHSVALKSDGTLVSWGGNEYGQRNALAGYTDFKAIHASVLGTFGITELPVFLAQPGPVTADAGTEARLSAEVIASGPISYQWFRNDVAVRGATNDLLVLDNPQDAHAGTYRLRATTAAGSIDSSDAQLTVQTNAPVITVFTPEISVAEGASTNLYVEARGSEPFQFLWSHNGIALPGETNAHLFLANITAAQAGTYEVTVSNAVGSVSSGRANLSVNLLPRILNALTNVTLEAGGTFSLQGEAAGTEPLAITWFQGEKLLARGATVQLRNVQAGNAGPLWLVVSNTFGLTSNVVANLTIQHRAPLITRQPVDQALQTNAPAIFSVGVMGTEPMQFQWSKNGAPIEGATNRVFVLFSSAAGDLAAYSVRVSNAHGAVASGPASLRADPTAGGSFEWPSIKLESVAGGLTALTDISHAKDGSGRLFLLEQAGRVRVLQNGTVLPAPFLDISAQVMSGQERGLLGIAFAPDYSQSGEFYLNYTRRPDGATVVSRFNSLPGSNLADTNSEVRLLTIPQPAPNHNGGQLAFGPDGYLYIASGDGGGQGDPFNNGQNTNTLLGKMLRIDVSGSRTNYAVPAANPFVGREGYRPEIWALGLRNPWRFSFDRLTGDMFIADVGEASLEEVNFQPRSSAGGENYGWSLFEGSRRTPKATNELDLTRFTFPVTEYGRTNGISVTGGYVSRHPNAERLFGIYLFSDFGSGRLWGLRRAGNAWERYEFPTRLTRPTSFGEDEVGNIYVAMNTGLNNSQVVRLYDSNEALPPALTPRPAFYNAPQTVTLTSSPGATIHYRRDGVEPTQADPSVASGESILVDTNQNLTVRAFRADLEPSEIMRGTYNFYVSLGITPNASLVTNGTMLMITSAQPNVTIRYTLDGSEVTSTSSIYSGPIRLAGNQTLRAVGSKEGWGPGVELTHFFGLLRPEKFAIRAFAGSGSADMTNGPALAAAFHEPQGLAFDAHGNLFVADTRNRLVRKIATNGMVSTVPGLDNLVAPVGVTLDASGNLYVGDEDGYKIYKGSTSGLVSTIAGTGERGLRDGPLESALLANVTYLESVPDGTLYFSDFAMVRKVTPEGHITHVGGDSGNNIFWLSSEVGLARAGDGTLFAASSHGRIFKVPGAGAELEHFAGAGPLLGFDSKPSDGTRLEAWFRDDYYLNRSIGRDLVFDPHGNLFVGDRQRIRKINPAGDVSTLVLSSEDPVNDGSPIQFATGLAVDSIGSLYVADLTANRIWKLAPDSDLDNVLDTEEGVGTAFVLGEDDRLRDNDRDGISNADEYRGGTNPSAPENNVVRLGLNRLPGGEIELVWNSEPGQQYKLQTTSTLIEWTDAGEWTVGTGSNLTARITPQGAAFYRITTQGGAM